MASRLLRSTSRVPSSSFLSVSFEHFLSLHWLNPYSKRHSFTFLNCAIIQRERHQWHKDSLCKKYSALLYFHLIVYFVFEFLKAKQIIMWNERIECWTHLFRFWIGMHPKIYLVWFRIIGFRWQLGSYDQILLRSVYWFQVASRFTGSTGTVWALIGFRWRVGSNNI